MDHLLTIKIILNICTDSQYFFEQSMTFLILSQICENHFIAINYIQKTYEIHKSIRVNDQKV